MTLHELTGTVLAVSRDEKHRFTKPVVDEVVLIAGWGIEGDTHAGITVQHRSRVARDPNQPNLRQVHLLHSELFAELAGAGYAVDPGQLGENITTRGIDLLDLPTGTLLHLGESAIVQITGLRNPCQQINGFEDGLLRLLVGRADDGSVERKGGIMSVVTRGGSVRPGDVIRAELPPGEQLPLLPV